MLVSEIKIVMTENKPKVDCSSWFCLTSESNRKLSIERVKKKKSGLLEVKYCLKMIICPKKANF